MDLNKLIAARPVFIFIFLALGVLLLPCIVIPWWHNIIKHMKKDIDLETSRFRVALASEIENIANSLRPISSSSINLARVVSSSIRGSQFKVQPLLFEAFLTLPYVSQISYIELDGVCFSYYYEDNQTFALYSNTSNQNPRRKYSWYKQLVDPNTGELFGAANETIFSITMNASWIQEALNSATAYASLGVGWNNDQDVMFLNSARINGLQGVISLGFSVEEVMGLFKAINLYGGNLSLATQLGEVLVGEFPYNQTLVSGASDSFRSPIALSRSGDGNQASATQAVSCFPNNAIARDSVLEVSGTMWKVYCSPIELVGVNSVYILSFPNEGIVSAVHRSTKIALILLIVLIIAVLISTLSFILLIVRAATREMHLSDALVKQMEATQQAEAKSINKSLTFAKESHDMRNALVVLSALIEDCRTLVAAGSELDSKLDLMDRRREDLHRLLDNILDQSKIEAGKIQLENEGFDLHQLLEDAVDSYHLVGIRKGVEVVLDSCDGSVMKFSSVKGDSGRLKQVVWNLLSNAVKFTDEGYVTVRGWAKKPSLHDAILASSRKGFWRSFSRWCKINKGAGEDPESKNNAMRQNPNAMEFVVEVEDTGKGIPKDKWKSVFENYVQVKESAQNKGGTGLGLGNVQSLVRLMGGDIEIVDKENGEPGSCFRFNVFLTTVENPSTDSWKNQGNSSGDSISALQSSTRTTNPGLVICNPSPRLPILSPKTEGSHVILMIQNAERRRSIQKFMDGLGIKISVANQNDIYSFLHKIKSKMNFSSQDSTRVETSSGSDFSSTRWKNVALSNMDGAEERMPSYTNRSVRRALGFILLVVETTDATVDKIYAAVSEFRSGLSNPCRVVWLNKPNSTRVQQNMVEPGDIILQQPLHGSRLYGVIKLLPEFGGALSCGGSMKSSKDPSSSGLHSRSRTTSGISPFGSHSLQQFETATDRHASRQNEIQELGEGKPLSGKRFLVAEDDRVLRRMTAAVLEKLGAEVEVCENGDEAQTLVCIGLEQQKREGATSFAPPYHYILMDCEMPVTNGYEASRLIRNEEKRYGVRCPIIALTAHNAGGEEANKVYDVGMDYLLMKPLRDSTLKEAIKSIKTMNTASL